MTKETEEKLTGDKSNENADQTVSTPTEMSQSNCENNVIVKSKGKKTNEGNTNHKSHTPEKSENKVEKSNLDNSGKRGSGGQIEKSGVKDGSEGKNTTINQDRNDRKKIDENEEEDIPGDFFDDFLKEDFMAGLDIVDDDAWEKELEADVSKDAPVTNTLETKKRSEKKKSKSSKIDHVERFNLSPPGEKRIKQKKRKQEDKEIDQKHTKNKEKVIDADEFDIRRDPKKTKRDIEQYKAKCKKDKEKKIISEKLSLVETGLVPPGMEMEMDIEEVKRQKSKIESKIEQPPRDLRDRLRKLRSKSKSPSRRQRSPIQKITIYRSASPLRKSSPKKRRTRSPKVAKSPLRRSPLRRSPLRRSPLQESTLKRIPVIGVTNSQLKSPIRPRRSPLPPRGPRRSQDRSYDTKSASRRSRSISPYYRGRRSRYSPIHRRNRSSSRESDREKWLRRRRSRSRSPRRRRDEKKSFLQEIAEKLNETRPQPVHMMPPLQPPMHFVLPQQLQPSPVPVPAPPTPVPPPSNPQYFPPHPQQQPQQQFDPYDQNFFIGTPQPVGPPHFVGQQHQNKPPPPAVSYPPLQPQKPSIPLSIQPVNSPQLPNRSSSAGSNISRNMDHSVPQSPQGQTNSIVGNKEDLAKLFQDKKITLSEFLAITAKPEVLSSSPANLKEKIKVIQRCHEAIKILGNAEKKYTGKLVVHRTDNYKVLTETNSSPLLKKPQVLFPFTHHQARHEYKNSFNVFINELLQKIGLMKEVVVDVDNEMPINVGISPTPRALSPPPPPSITHARNVIHNERSVRSNKLTSSQFSKMIQTDVFKCESCEKRKKILYKTSAVQCGGEATCFSVSTQVTEDDFYPKSHKTQSLASLTPAQLLAKSREGSNRMIDKDSFDILPSQSNYANRINFQHPSDSSYNLSRYRSPSPPSQLFNAPSREEALYNAANLRSQFVGGGRGRGLLPDPRVMDSFNNRFGYNNYF